MGYCIANNKAGKPCMAQAMGGATYCYRHNPEISDADKLQASIDGGKSKAVLKDADPVSLRTIGSIISLIEGNINAVRTGELDPKVSNAVVQNINALLTVYELSLADTRIRRLEQGAGLESPDELINIGGN